MSSQAPAGEPSAALLAAPFGPIPKHRCNNGGAGYPALRLLVLMSYGTRTIIDAVFGPTTDGETT